MVGILIRMNLAAQRTAWTGMRLFWAGAGFLLALGTLSLGITRADTPDVAVDLLASAFAAWTLMLALAPVFGGGSGIRAEHFALLPIPPRSLALGLLGAAVVGIGPAIALVAFAAHAVYGFQLGATPGVTGIVAMLLQLVVAVLLARVVHSVMGAAMQTRLGMEVVAFQYGLFIALISVGWFVLQPVTGQVDQVMAEGWPPLISNVVRALPSGWGIVAVDAVSRGNWALAAGIVLGFAALIGGLLQVWATLLARSATSVPASRPLPGGASSKRAVRHHWLPPTALGAVVSKEFRTWTRDPWRALELRVALWAGVLMGAIPLLIGVTEGLPFVGVLIAVMGATVSGNLYGLDGSALWQTVLTPGAERIDVRGRQGAWLLIFGPIALGATIVLTLLSGHQWAWPLVLALLFAALDGATGLVPLFSVLFPSPGLDPRLRKNPMDSSGDMMTELFFMPWLVLLTTAPALAVVVMGMVRDNPVLQWAGVPVGLATGALFAWGLGWAAYRRLEANGPELVNHLLRGATPQSRAAEKKRPADEAWKTLPFGKKAIVRLCYSLFWLPLFPQGLAPLVFKLAGIEAKSWFLALYLPAQYQWLVIVAMIGIGSAMLAIAIQIPRMHRRRYEQHQANTASE